MFSNNFDTLSMLLPAALEDFAFIYKIIAF